METTRPMVRSPVALARKAMEIAQAALPAYSSRFSRQDFTQHQLFALMVLATYLKLDHRGIVAVVEDWSDVRATLGLTRVPHWSTLYKAQQRLLKKIGLPSCSRLFLATRPPKAWSAARKRPASTRRALMRGTARRITPGEPAKNATNCETGPS